MKDSNEKDELRFNKLYQLLGEELNKIYEDNSNSIFPKTDTINEEQPPFTDTFNIFSKQDPTPNSEEYIDTTNNQITTSLNNNKYLEELNILIDEYNTSEEISEVKENFDSEKVENILNTTSKENDSEINEIVSVTNDITEPIINEEIYIEPTKIEVTNITKEIKKNDDNKYNIEHKNEIRNKTLINSKNIYDDGLDEVCAKTTIMDILTNHKTIHILLIIIFIVMFILVIKAFRFGKLVDIYNEYTTETSKVGNNDTKIYDDNDVDIETLKKAAAGELIDCINAKIDTNKLPDEVNSIIKEINDYYHTSGKYFAFAYKDLFSGFTVTYNETGNVFAASTIKAPVNIYLYEMANQNKINLDEELTYTPKYYNDGTGVLKNKPTNTNYSIRTLSEYAIRNSDNAAHNMLMDKYGKNNIKKFWQDKGTNIIFTGSDNWGLINAHDAMIYMKELYTFYINNDEYGNELMNNFINAKTKFIIGKNDYKVANKSGWSGTAQHDVSIVFAENPYIVVALSNLGYDNNYMTYFNKANDLAYKLHNEYWKYKMAMCSNIKQYN